jgi:hypothetical protein
MNPTPKHTPTPWRVGDAGFTVFGPKTDQPSPVTIAPCKSKANAAHIVKCVNLHDELVDFALEVQRIVKEKPSALVEVYLKDLFEDKKDLLTRAKAAK